MKTYYHLLQEYMALRQYIIDCFKEDVDVYNDITISETIYYNSESINSIASSKGCVITNSGYEIRFITLTLEDLLEVFSEYEKLVVNN